MNCTCNMCMTHRSILISLVVNEKYYYVNTQVSHLNYISAVQLQLHGRVSTDEYIFTLTEYCHLQCLKLRVHPAPCVHIWTAAGTYISNCAAVYAHFFVTYLYLYVRKTHEQTVGCTSTYGPGVCTK